MCSRPAQARGRKKISLSEKSEMDELRMKKEFIEKLAREKAEKAAKQEAWVAHFAGLLPFIFAACIMAVRGIPTVIYTVVVLSGLVAGWLVYSAIKPEAFKKYYKKYLEEFTPGRRPEQRSKPEHKIKIPSAATKPQSHSVHIPNRRKQQRSQITKVP